MPNNYWLFDQLENGYVVDIDKNYDPTINFAFETFRFRVYTPSSSEYIVSADVIEKAFAAGANIVAYANSWAGPTIAGKEYAEERGIKVLSYRDFFIFLRQKGARRV